MLVSGWRKLLSCSCFSVSAGLLVLCKKTNLNKPSFLLDFSVKKTSAATFVVRLLKQSFASHNFQLRVDSVFPARPLGLSRLCVGGGVSIPGPTSSLILLHLLVWRQILTAVAGFWGAPGKEQICPGNACFSSFFLLFSRLLQESTGGQGTKAALKEEGGKEGGSREISLLDK